MFICEKTGEQSKPGQKMVRVPVSTRTMHYINAADEIVATGYEIIRELRIAVPFDAEVMKKPLIIGQGRQKEVTVDTARKRAIRDGRTVYITLPYNNNRVILEVSPQGDLREVPPVGLAIGLMDHASYNYLSLAEKSECEGRITKQRQRMMGHIAQFSKLAEAATKKEHSAVKVG